MVRCNFQLQFNSTAFLTDTTSVGLAQVQVVIEAEPGTLPKYSNVEELHGKCLNL